MKELTIEQKAEAYDKAIKVAKSKIKNNKDHVLYEEDITDIFPELKESEDKKIIKAIKLFFELQDDNTTFSLIPKKDILAWLEKQMEHINFLSKIQVGDKVTRNEAGILVNISQLNRIAKPAKKRGEQKPTDKVEPKFKVKYADSEYNVLEVKDIAGVTYYGIEDEPNHIDYVQAENCERIGGYSIKANGCSFPTKPIMFSEQKPAWSEEDEYYRNIILYILNNECVGETDKENAIHWLKSLRPQKQWKPSEEQIIALDEVYKTHGANSACRRILLKLLNDLKKLMEE